MHRYFGFGGKETGAKTTISYHLEIAICIIVKVLFTQDYLFFVFFEMHAGLPNYQYTLII